MSSMNEIVKTLQDAVSRQTNQAKPTAYDTPAVVRRVEGDTAWVHIPDGVDETPVKMTINAKEGDQVQVRVSGGSAFMVGNGTAPPTDDAKAKQAYTIATVAEGAAENALANANLAKEAADTARGEAIRAGEAADRAEGKADDAADAATSAQQSADSALVNLSTVQDVVGVLNWITAHGTMTLTSDVTVNPAHVYFVVDPAGDYVVGGTHYSIVSEPKDAELSTYYELTVDESVQNYVATHIVVDTEGLWIVPDRGGNKVLIATGSGSTYTTAGTYIIGKVNNVDTVFAKFTASGAQIGESDKSHLIEDYRSLQLIDKSGNTYVDLRDLRDENNYIDENFVGDGSTTTFTFKYENSSSLAIVTINGVTVPSSEYGCDSEDIYFDTAPANGAAIVVSHKTSSKWVKAYTLGTRRGTVGGMSMAEGRQTIASGDNSHAEGYLSSASGENSHAEGNNARARGECSHAEGEDTQASGKYGHVEGYQTLCVNTASHAEGYQTEASGRYSHAQNRGTDASCMSQTVIGEYNVRDTNGTPVTRGDYALIIGNGADDSNPSNALTVDWSGNVVAAGGADLAALTENSGTYSGGLNDEALLTSATITKLEAWLNS